MTKLTATEIKGLIEEKGSNTLTLVIEVPNHFFGMQEEQQKHAVSMGILGFNGDIKVESLMFLGVGSNTSRIKIQVSVTFTEALLENLSNPPVEKSVLLEDGFSIEELQQLVADGISTFQLKTHFRFLSREVEYQNRIVSDAILKNHLFGGIEILHSSARADSGLIIVQVRIRNFDKQVAFLVERAAQFRDKIASLEVEGATYLAHPLTKSDIERIIQEENENVDIEEEDFFDAVAVRHFCYLVDIDYDFLIENEDFVIVDHYKELIIGDLGYEIEDFEHIPVGVVGDSLIVKLEGYLLISNEE